MLFRAVAYRHQLLTDIGEPEVAVFFEAPSPADAVAVLTALLATAWGVPADEVDHYNLWSEAELLRNSACDGCLAGEAYLMENGWCHGPLFVRPDRTLMLVRPSTLRRLLVARQHADTLRNQQRRDAAAASGADLSTTSVASSRQRMQERAEAAGVAAMGGSC